MKKTFTLFSLLALCCVFFALSAQAASYPERPVTLIVPYAAGGGTDTQARIAAAALEKILKGTLTVVNKTGGNGVIGFSEAATAKPNGYTLGYLAYPDVMIPPLYKKTPYKPEDFIYIASFNSTPTCLIFKAGAPYANLKDFVDYAGKNPKRVTVGIASDSHMLAVVMLGASAKIELTPVVYKSGSEALNAVMGGHVDTAMIAPQFGKIAIQEKLPVVGVTSAARIKVMPDVPTFAEQGYKVDMLMNRIFVAPKGTPAEIVKILSEACAVAAKDENLIKNVEQAGDEYVFMGGEDLVRYIQEKDKEYTPVITGNLNLFGK